MTYTIKQVAELSGLSEHTLRFYTDQNLVPCTRDSANRRVFDDTSLNWLNGVRCLRSCGISVEDIKYYCDLCRAQENTVQQRYEFLLKQRELAYRRLQEAQTAVEFMERKVALCEEILSGETEDKMNLNRNG